MCSHHAAPCLAANSGGNKGRFLEAYKVLEVAVRGNETFATLGADALTTVGEARRHEGLHFLSGEHLLHEIVEAFDDLVGANLEDKRLPALLLRGVENIARGKEARVIDDGELARLGEARARKPRGVCDGALALLDNDVFDPTLGGLDSLRVHLHIRGGREGCAKEGASGSAHERPAPEHVAL
eukprot:CAMPEP_0185171032 /NCGR_PEP_ID=MMETSP1139-20130426/19601_1 /TAXON_ID=298111 /ORGANISM="Pavlova sp., Strain CCMP459" /LENGTH=182 /DNA_ID=CAMNT_0027736631 /DNA_START=232 /DNA_END=777 /DNA_ORIENTATION=-